VGLYLEVNIYSLQYIIQWNVLNNFWCLTKKEVEFLHFIFVFLTLQIVLKRKALATLTSCLIINYNVYIYEGWNFNSGNYLFTTDTK